VASWYGRKFHGRRTASGERFDMYAMTAAHRRLPLPCYVRVRNLQNGRSVVVRVNDRGPFHENRIIDLSYAAASKLGMLGRGTALVEIRAIDPRRPEPVRHTASPQPAHAPRIYVQVGAFGDRRNARRLAARLERELRREVHIQSADASRGRILRVRIGPLASVEIADQVVATLEQMNIHDSQLLLR
jgi:rare lipoprotein A